VAATVALWGYVSAATAAALATIGITAPLWAVIAVVAVLIGIVYEIVTHWDGIKKFFSGLWDDVKHIFTSAIDGIKKAWDSFWGGFSNPGAKIADSVKGIDRIFLGLGSNVKRSIDGVTKFIKGGPAEWGRVMGEAAGFLTKKGWEMLQGLYHGIVDGAKAANDWILNFPHMVENGLKTGFSAAGHWLLQAGKDIVDGFVQGAKGTYHDVVDFFTTDIPNAFKWLVDNGPHLLWQTGKDILVGLWNGFTSFLGNIWGGIKDFISGFIKGFLQGFGVASPSTVMHSIGIDIIVGLWNGFSSWIGNIFSNIGNFISGIINQWAGSATWLVSAGYNLLVGIWNGIASGWSWLMGKVSSLATSIKNTALSALGISSPSKVFADEVGAWIAPGIAQGIEATAHQAVHSVQSLAANMISAWTGTAGMGLHLGSPGGMTLPGGNTIALPASMTAAGGDGGLTVNVHVAGHVWQTRDLVKEIQTELLRHGVRNNNTGIVYTGFS